LLLGLLAVVWVVDKIASGTKFAKSVLMEITAHFLTNCWLVQREFSYSMSKETVWTVMAVTSFSETLAKLELAFVFIKGCSFIANYLYTHSL
jgi:hypothetical protein